MIGGAGMLGLAILVFGRYFPLVPSHVTDEQRHTPVPRDPLRSIVSLVWLFGSLALIIFGLGDSFRLWSHGELDPRVPFSPAIFATGVILLFSTAIVYEAFPARRRTPPARVASG